MPEPRYSPEFGRNWTREGRGHHESDWEAESRIIGRAIKRREEQDMAMSQQAAEERDARAEASRKHRAEQRGAKPAITVSIDVTTGGYTGQRDQWEEHLQQYKVELHDGDMVVLTSHDDGKISFHKDGLEAALKILEDYKP